MSAQAHSDSSVTRTGVVAGFIGFLFAMELCSGFLQGWFSPILSGLGERFGVGAADLNWVQTSYLLATAVLVPLLAKLGDLYGHKRILVVATAMVTVGSFVAALAPTWGVFLAGRAITGALAVFLPLEFAIVRERAGKKSGKAIGLLVGGLTLGASVGVLLSGILASFLSLTVVLLVPAVLMLLALFVVIFLVPETIVRKSGSLDLAGALLFGLGLAVLLAAVAQGNTLGWLSLPVAGGIVLGLALLATFLVVERRVASPFIELSMLTGPRGIGLPVLIAALFGACMFGGQTPAALFMAIDPTITGFGLGLAPAVIGLALVLSALSAFGGTFIGPRLGARVGDVVAVVIGATALAAGQFLLAGFHNDIVLFLSWSVLAGVGTGIVMAALPNVVVSRAPSDSIGIASGLYNSARTVAGAVAGAAFTAVMIGFLVPVDDGGVITGEAGYAAVWMICGALALGVAVLALVLNARSRTEAPAAAAPELEVAA